MTKRFWFVTAGHGLAPDELRRRLADDVERRRHGPLGARPRRATMSVSAALDPAGPASLGTGPGADRPGPDAVVCEWFDDEPHVARFEAWLASGGGLGAAAFGDGSDGAERVVVADEEVRRGAGWLARRWRVGGPVWKHMALAVRAEGLSAAEASSRWRAGAGRVGGGNGAAPTPIPAEILGRAYVQNHPRPRAEGEWPYDAVNEVYFDDAEGVARRAAWFAARADLVARDDVFARSWFLSTEETVCFDTAVG